MQAGAQDRRTEMNTVNAVNANWPFKFGGPYYSHIFIDKIYEDSDVIIPCQSVYDVQIAARLGFKFIEGNVHKTATPGKYIVMHGEGGKLGGQVMYKDGRSAKDVLRRPHEQFRVPLQIREIPHPPHIPGRVPDRMQKEQHRADDPARR